MNSEMPTSEPERTWFRAGAAAEAQLRKAPREQLPKYTRDLLTYLDAVVKHEDPMDPGELLARAVHVFESTMSRAEKRQIRRALRGRR